jgi:ribosomal protein S18 acetylase RimI-like enzyme
MLAERISAAYSNAQRFPVEGKKAIMIKCREATPADAEDIARLIAAVWPGQAVHPARIRRALAEEDRSTVLALAAGEVVGFVDGFLTRSDDGRPRWEIDLLAVQPAARGRGIATQLIRESATAGWAAAAETLRALIRVGNTGARLAFERSGFAADVEREGLYVCDCPERLDIPELPDGLHLLSVSTLMYSGLWLEGRLSERSFSAAASECAQRGLDLAGAVIPERKGHLTRAASAAGYERIGEYHWFRLEPDQFTR